MTALERWRQQRNQHLLDLDMEWARQQVPGISDEAQLIGMHKARVECVDLPAEARLLSVEWLREHGFKRSGGLDLPPPGELPT